MSDPASSLSDLRASLALVRDRLGDLEPVIRPLDSATSVRQAAVMVSRAIALIDEAEPDTIEAEMLAFYADADWKEILNQSVAGTTDTFKAELAHLAGDAWLLRVSKQDGEESSQSAFACSSRTQAAATACAELSDWLRYYEIPF